jgi:phenylacetic acid degradation operon negative regulatory protein
LADRFTDVATIEQVETPNVRTQFLIFTLFGDYILPRGGAIWASSLLELLDLLGVSERAARSALSRMASRGWLIARKQGRRSQYSLTTQGQRLIERSERRIFEPPYADWDGLWHMVIYSLPESKRDLRHTLRTQLIWLGFGPLAPATWISPRDRRAEVEAICNELGMRDRVDLFSGLYQRSTSDRALIERCWDLPALEAAYRQFIARYEAEYADLRSLGPARLSGAPEMCFARRFWITHEFQRFPRKDPGLPVALLPPGWIGFGARQLFDGYRQLLEPYANQFVDKVLSDE